MRTQEPVSEARGQSHHEHARRDHVCPVHVGPRTQEEGAITAELTLEKEKHLMVLQPQRGQPYVTGMLLLLVGGLHGVRL